MFRQINAAGDEADKLAKIFYQSKEQMHADFPDECEPPSIDNARACASLYLEVAYGIEQVDHA
jgi:hypothetical protein